jgi:hypothetical protein
VNVLDTNRPRTGLREPHSVLLMGMPHSGGGFRELRHTCGGSCELHPTTPEERQPGCDLPRQHNRGERHLGSVDGRGRGSTGSAGGRREPLNRLVQVSGYLLYFSTLAIGQKQIPEVLGDPIFDFGKTARLVISLWMISLLPFRRRPDQSEKNTSCWKHLLKEDQSSSPRQV